MLRNGLQQPDNIKKAGESTGEHEMLLPSSSRPISQPVGSKPASGFGCLAPLLLGFVVALTWMGAFVVTGIRLPFWPCPRCGERFSTKGVYNKSFLARKCVHCGLPKYAVDDLEDNR